MQMQWWNVSTLAHVLHLSTNLQYWGYFHFKPLYMPTSTTLHYGEKHCTFYSTTLIYQLIYSLQLQLGLWIQIDNIKHKSTSRLLNSLLGYLPIAYPALGLLHIKQLKLVPPLSVAKLKSTHSCMIQQAYDSPTLHQAYFYYFTLLLVL